jgi:clan AA aspartic protease (TIGR02281 family)
MKLLMLGVSLATLAVTTIPAQAGRYVVDQCSPNQGREKWFLIFDTQTSTTNFSRAGDDKPRYGAYTMSYGITYSNVTNDTVAPMDLKLRPNHDPAGNPVLEWTSGTESSTMLCEFLYEKDYTPANWVSLPSAQPDPPVVAESTPETAIPPSTTALAPEPTPTQPTQSTPSILVVPITSDGVGGHKVDVTLGIGTPETMLIDTGATIVSLPQDIADQLISIGDAVVITEGRFTTADGTTSTQNIIDIGRFTIGGRTIYHVKAGVGPIGSMMLLGTNVLNRFGKYSVDPANNQLILG